MPEWLKIVKSEMIPIVWKIRQKCFLEWTPSLLDDFVFLLKLHLLTWCFVGITMWVMGCYHAMYPFYQNIVYYVLLFYVVSVITINVSY